jgi:hypothetical protein
MEIMTDTGTREELKRRLDELSEQYLKSQQGNPKRNSRIAKATSRNEKK